jgi:phosphate uptake regulator
MKVIERNLQEIGKSLFISLPKEWTKLLKLHKGSQVKIIISDQGTLAIAPEFTKQEKKKESEIIYDEQFKRKFFREYFEGNDRITILIKNKLNDKEKKEIYSFFKMFMNIQIIEEDLSKIVLKCFKIEDLSIEECFKRMYFLSINIIDEIGKNNKTAIKEMRDTMTRFYYMLVIQVRRFLDEGKYSKENQISLIRALDFRMAAEKVQRVAEISESIEKIEHEEMKKLLDIVKDYYSKAALCFINSNFEKALALWSEEKIIKSKSSKIKNQAEKESLESIMKISRYSKEITMLVR